MGKSKKNKTVYAVVGGDLRQACLANILASKKEDSVIYGVYLDENIELSEKIIKTDDIESILPICDVIIFPLPFTIDGVNLNTPFSKEKINLTKCFEKIRKDCYIFAGMVPEKIHELGYKYNLSIIDHFKREELTVLNAVLTAEGAIEIALQELARTIFGIDCVIIGYGRIAKALAPILRAFGANVKIAARKQEDLAWIRINNCIPVHISELDSKLINAELIFNTVPSVVLDEKRLEIVNKECLIIDLASKPGGVDFDTAKDLGLKVIWALSIPGKASPVTAGEILLDTILNIIQENS